MGHRPGMKAGLGLQGLPSLSLSHPVCLLLSALLYLSLLSCSLRVSPNLCLSVSLSTSLSLSLHVSVLTSLSCNTWNTRSLNCRKSGFPPTWRLIPWTTGSKIFSRDPRETGGREQDWNSLWGPLEVNRGVVNNSNNYYNDVGNSFSHQIIPPGG